MAGNSFGTVFRLTTYGESHGKSIGGIIDGCPAGLEIDQAYIQQQLDFRKPGQSSLTTARREEDQVEFLSGIFEGKSTGTPIAFQIENKDAKSKDYGHLKSTYRPSHADFVYQEKYGHRDYRGGGRSSARETACRVVAGAVAELILKQYGVEIFAYVQQVGTLSLMKHYNDLKLEHTFQNDVRCPDESMAIEMQEYIAQIKKQGDTVGGAIQTVVKGCLVGLGEPVFDKLHADLAKGLMSINATKGIEFGSGFCAAEMLGSQHNDVFIQKEERVGTATNNSGGIQGGISNGEDIYFRLAFKPVATIMQQQKSVNDKGEEVNVAGKGRHDPCVVPRAVPIVKSMTALVLVDHLLRNKLSKI